MSDNEWIRLTSKLNAEHTTESGTTTLAEYRYRPDNEYGLCHELRNVYEGRVLPSSAVDDALYFTTAELANIPIIKALAEAADFAQRTMNDYGNATNWPPDMSMEYATAINKLRDALVFWKEKDDAV